MTNPNLTILLRIATPKSSEFFRWIKCASSGGITKLKAHRLCAFASSSIVPRNFCSSAQSSHKLNPHGKLYNRPIAVRAPLAGIQQDPRLLLACRLENFGWEAWTRTRIARFRIWSPANWTTSQRLCVTFVRSQRGPTKTNRSTFPSSGQLRFNSFRLNAFSASVNPPATAFRRPFLRLSGQSRPFRRAPSTEIRIRPM